MSSDVSILVLQVLSPGPDRGGCRLMQNTSVPERLTKDIQEQRHSYCHTGGTRHAPEAADNAPLRGQLRAQAAHVHAGDACVHERQPLRPTLTQLYAVHLAFPFNCLSRRASCGDYLPTGFRRLYTVAPPVEP